MDASPVTMGFTHTHTHTHTHMHTHTTSELNGIVKRPNHRLTKSRIPYLNLGLILQGSENLESVPGFATNLVVEL